MLAGLAAPAHADDAADKSIDKSIAKPRITYRPDIDGLRAIAVLAVVLFHADVPWASGGYVGVDVFFVISGYLITALILEQQDRDRFTLAWFYERRIRRILPALLVVLLACVIGGWLFMTPNDYKSLAGSILATALFSSNVLLWRPGYFDTDAETQPLLHTWSLAVEEQFYIFFPLLLMVLNRFRRGTIFRMIVILAASSFVASSVLVFYRPNSVFYLAPFRAWELLLGAMLTAWHPFVKVGSRGRNFSAMSGLVAIVIAVLFYSKETPFPGIAALLPAGGTAMIILAGMDKLPMTNRLIASPPLLFFGKISYSLYLWHYVLLAFGAYLTIWKMPAIFVAKLVGASIALATLSWLLIEQPVRRAKSRLLTGTPIFCATGLAIALFAVAGWTIRAKNGFEIRFSSEQLALLSEVTAPEITDCQMLTTARAVESRQFCKVGSKLPERSFFVWGDSHAGSFLPALNDLAVKQHAAGLLATTGGCPPLIGIERKEATAFDCASINQKIMQFVIDDALVQTVILIGRWPQYVEGGSYRDQPTNLQNPKRLLLASRSIPGANSTEEMMRVGFDQTISTLITAKKHVVIVASVPEVEVNVPKSIYLRSIGIDGRHIEPTREDFDTRQAASMDLLKGIANKYHVTVLRPDSILCSQKLCVVEAASKPLYVDTNHLSYSGALLVEPIFQSVQIK
jgi:peptidoglycan/LPS O-acetylase OafA/YrhL